MKIIPNIVSDWPKLTWVAVLAPGTDDIHLWHGSAVETAEDWIVEAVWNGDFKLGDTVGVDVFVEGEFVDVIGTSKGKGFQGVVKRHGFAGVGQSTHGQHNRLRAPGSIGAASYPARVFKGMKMAGRMGGDRVTVQNLKVLKVVPEKNLLVVKGCVPGHKNAYVTIQRWM